jgi:hypothetical protein
VIPRLRITGTQNSSGKVCGTLQVRTVVGQGTDLFRGAVLHAVKDIAKGEEISVSYGSTDPEYLEDRFLWLQTNFAFDCGCPSHSATSIPPPLAFPSPLNSGSALPEEVLASLDTLLLAGCRAGLVAQVAISALQAAELCALWGDDDAGRAWARLAWGVSCLYKGRAASESVEAARLMEDPMKRWNWGLRGFEALPGPVSRSLVCFSGRLIFH